MKRQLFSLTLAAVIFMYPLTAALAQEQSKATTTEQEKQNPDQKAEDQKTAPAEPQVQEECKDKNKKHCVSEIGNRNTGKGLDFYSLEKEIALGKQLAQEVDRSAKFIDDPVVLDYINKVGQNLVRNSDAQVPFTIKVIDSDVLNAFALPGGFFYVNSGLILHADEESEIAGVMAHEIAHVCARHGTKNATKGQLINMAMIPLILLGPTGWAGYGMREAINFLLPIGFLKFSRDAEREADYLGLQYMFKAGYDPNSFISFFERVEAEEKKHPGTIPKIFSSHPPTPDRIEAIQKEIVTILPTREEYIVTTSEFDRVKARLAGIQAGLKAKNTGPDQPTLRKKTDPNSNGKTDPDNDPDKPTLKKRPDQ